MSSVAVLDPVDACDLTEALALAETALRRVWEPMPHQIPPGGDWRVWLLEGGRGSGKTDGAAHYVDQHVNGPPCIPGYPGGHRPAIIAPTLGDALEACVNGPSGLRAHNPGIRLVQGMGGAHVRWPNGVEGKLFGAYTPEDVERLRAGGNRCLVWTEELAAWARLAACWDQMTLGLRIGRRPHVVASSTPKPHKKYLEIRSDERTARTGASTALNPYLDEEVRAQYFRIYGGTRLGRQELNAEILDDVLGALWKYAMFEARRPAPDLVRCVVGVDPSGGSDPENDEQGIVVGGKGSDGHGYVVADRSCRLSPDGWGRRAVQAYVDFKADAIVVEKNFGGDMAESVIRSAARAMGVTVKVVMVTASRGKALRAQPVAGLYEQGRMHHVEVFAELEEQCVIQGTRVLTRGEWTPIEWIRPGDVVLTRAGLRRVLRAGQTGIARSIRIETGNGLILHATANHPIHTPDRGFVRADQVGARDKITTCHNQFVGPLLSIAGCGTSSTTVGISEPADRTAGDSFTETSIWTPTGRSLTSTTSITVTTISRTTPPATSSPLRRASTDWSTDREATPHGPLNSVARRLGANGSNPSRESGIASHADRSSSLQASERHFVVDPASVATVRSVQVCQDLVPVWNLMVEDQPEFFANGILTHNCTTWTPESGTSPDRLDALVWVATETMLGPQTRPFSASAGGTRPLVQGYQQVRRA